MSAFVECRQAIADGLQAAFKARGLEVQTRPHGGSITKDEIVGRLAVKPPALFVGAMGASAVRVQGPKATLMVSWAAFLIANNSIKENRDTAILTMAAIALASISHERWGGLGTTKAEDVTATNLYSVPLDKAGLSLWGVRWRQGLELDTTVSADELDLFRYLDGTVNPEGAIKNDTLPLFSEAEMEQD